MNSYDLLQESIKLLDGHLISVINLGNVLKSGLNLQPYPVDRIKEDETDDSNDPVSFDAEPPSPFSFALPYASIESGTSASGAQKVSPLSVSGSKHTKGGGVSYFILGF